MVGENDRVTPIPPRLRPLLDRGLARSSSSRGGSSRPGTSATSSAAASATPSSTVPRTAATTSTSPPTPGPTRSSASCAAWADTCGSRASASAPSAASKDGTSLRDHDVPGRGVPAREPQARGRVRRRHRDRPVAPRLHGQRDGARVSPSRELVDPFGGAADLAAQRLRTPLAPEVSFARRPAAHAARGPVRRRASASSPTPELVAAVEELRDRLEIVSAERIRDELSKLLVVDDPTRGPVVPRRHRPRPTSSCPSSTRCGSSRTRSTATRTCSRTRSRSSRKTRPELRVRLAALLHDVGKPKTALVRARAA